MPTHAHTRRAAMRDANPAVPGRRVRRGLAPVQVHVRVLLREEPPRIHALWAPFVVLVGS